MIYLHRLFPGTTKDWLVDALAKILTAFSVVFKYSVDSFCLTVGIISKTDNHYTILSHNFVVLTYVPVYS